MGARTLNLALLALAAMWSADWAAADDDESDYRVRNTTTEFPYERALPMLESNPYRVSLFDPQHGEDRDRLWSQTKLLFGLGVGAGAIVASLPRNRDDGSLASEWWKNVSSGPVWDEDVWYVNYLGHPYFGGVYYQVARKSGYRQWDALVYSFLMSTFYWEYGLEAFAEVPSIQDIIITPIGGWLVGEWAYGKEREIRQGGGRVWGSKTLGSTVLFFLDPIDSIGVGINHLFGREVFNAGSAWVSDRPLGLPQSRADDPAERGTLLLHVTFQF